MALTNYQRQKRWRDKNRAIYNLRRRNARKNLGGGDALYASDHGRSEPEKEARTSPPLSKIEELRRLMETVSAAPVEPVVVKLTVYRDDYGRVITEHQWKALQDRKQRAKQGGYEIDEYSQ